MSDVLQPYIESHRLSNGREGFCHPMPDFRDGTLGYVTFVAAIQHARSRPVTRLGTGPGASILSDKIISIRNQTKAIEAERRKREEEAEEARIQGEIELEKKKAAEEEAERNRRVIDADKYNIAEAESRARSRSTSRSPSPKIRPAAINNRPREIRKDTQASQSRDVPQIRALWQQKNVYDAGEPSMKDIPEIAKEPMLPTGSVPITSAETKNDISLLFNAILEQQRKLGEQNAIIDELKQRISDREIHSERKKDIVNILRDREDDMTSRTNKLKDLMQMLLSKLSGIEQPNNIVNHPEVVVPQRENDSTGLRGFKNSRQGHDLAPPVEYEMTDDGPVASSMQDTSAVLDSRPPTQDKVAPAGQMSAAGTDRKSLFERSLVGTRMWLPVPQPPTTTLDTQYSYSDSRWRYPLAKSDGELQSLEHISSSTIFRPSTSKSSTLHTDASENNETDDSEEAINRVARMIKEMRSIEAGSSPSSASSSDSSLDLEDAVLPASSINSIRHLISSRSASVTRKDTLADDLSNSEGRNSSLTKTGDDPMLQTVVLSEHFYRSLPSEPDSPLWTATKDLREDLLEAVDRICAECDATTLRLSEVLGQPEPVPNKSDAPTRQSEDASSLRPFEQLEKMLSSGDLHLESDVVEELKLMTMMEHDLRSSVTHG